MKYYEEVKLDPTESVRNFSLITKFRSKGIQLVEIPKII